MSRNAITTLIFAAAAALASSQASALDKVTFATNWLAEAEHGGHYQALVDGTYAKYGLDVKILPGGPQTNNRLQLIAGKIEFYMNGNMIPSFTAVEENVPIRVVASMFQKDPIVFMSHPGQGFDKFSDLNRATIFVGKEVLVNIFQWMKQDYGFKDENVRPYAFNPAPFIANKKSVQQGYVTSEPFAIEQVGKFKPNLFLMADYGFDSYSTTIETRNDLIAQNPDLVQRFVDASIIGWYNYMYGDNSKANELIKRENPEMTDEQIAFSIAKMKEFGIVDSGDSLTLGIGAMTDARMKSFFDKMAKAKVIKADLDYRKSYTLQFVNKKVGLDLRPKN
ncbi:MULTISPECIES: ABC transporter substrate-binding protein [unclassified Beijerinckia]|uniref:ABC transporter substrate-binding protein n=1 Tax=unclassified Beijerinckia TaxID=2638183 RepID=UPI00089634B9|nr:MULTISPECIES: ABC transporter substrate-binding protein [unclassified Beijerinckia]MDH7793979.1 NitT/TauT family transport system substrate-binding protein [Beijerinckia sp. GAS462]SEB50691.1 NitT/TauT family transport system substrate-binding protein [Beijerinckia sp. 28-YEA-48]